MMNDKVRIGVIGVGLIGKTHLRNYADIPEAEVVAIADVNPLALDSVAEEFGITNTYTDFRELLNRDDIEAIDVCLHNNFHAPVTIEALRAGKHVYCEKPIAGSYADGNAMLEAAKACGKMLHIQLSSLYSRETRVAKHLLDEGKLGTVYHARSTGYRRRGRPYVDGYGTKFFVNKETASGGALYDMGVYNISRMLYLLGQPEVLRISGKVYQETDMDETRRLESGYNVEELGMGFVKMKDGIVLDIIESWAIHLDQFEGSYIVGAQGGIRLNPFSFHSTVSDIPFDMTSDLNLLTQRWRSLREDEGAYESSQKHWVAALRNQVPLLPTAALALQTMLISEGIYLSDAQESEVTAEEVRETSVSTAVKL